MIRLAVRVRPEDAEIVLAELLELAPSGVEERELDGAVEYAVYGAEGELPALGTLRAAAGGALVEIVSEEVGDDWAQRWRQFHRPLELDGLRVRPPWEPAADDGRLEIVVDPGQAFGTGAHPTTRLCLELLLELGPLPGGFLDVGCGSGVLAIAAAKLGYSPVHALDYDPLAVDATAVNAAVNAVALATVARNDLRTGELPPAATTAANILKPVLVACAARFGGERLILSGLLAAEAAEAAAAFAAHGWEQREARERGEWAALLLAR